MDVTLDAIIVEITGLHSAARVNQFMNHEAYFSFFRVPCDPTVGCSLGDCLPTDIGYICQNIANDTASVEVGFLNVCVHEQL